MDGLKPLRNKGFAVWLRNCYFVLGAHGWDLVEENTKVAYGKYATFPADADDDLRRAEALGWIVRGKLQPTLSQRAFLGLQYGAGTKIPDSHASCWFWMPAERGTDGYERAQAWLKEQGTPA